MNQRIFLLMLGLLVNSDRARAVIVFGTADDSAHTRAPTGALAGSGWNWQISVRGGGTIVGPAHILTAAHLGYWTNNIITWQGLDFRIIEVNDPPSTDLRLLRIAGRFGTWAPTLADTNEVSKPVVLFGLGGQRGSPITVEEAGQRKLCGWRWTATDPRLRWGTNVIEGIESNVPDGPGEFLMAHFTADAGDDEATVSGGDSGGGVFLQDEEGWKLAGVMSSVEGAFKQDPDSVFFNAALFDRRNFLEELSPGIWGFDPYRFARPGTIWLASRVSIYHDWLETRMAQAPAIPLPRLLSAPTVKGPFLEHPTYAIEPAVRQINLLRPGDQPIFFQIEGEPTLQVKSVTPEILTLQY